MEERDYNVCIGKILAGKPLNDEEANMFVDVLREFESMLDEGDQEDFYGTEGWHHRMGWD
jgi:hypothetical protein